MGSKDAFKLDEGRIMRTAALLGNPFGGDPSPIERMEIASTAAYAWIYATQGLDRFVERWDGWAHAEGCEDLAWDRLDDDGRHRALCVAARRHCRAEQQGALDRFWDRMLGFGCSAVVWDYRTLGAADRADDVVAVLHDDFGNTATVTRRRTLPYRGAPGRSEALVLTLTADYDGGFVYHVSVFESMAEVEARLAKVSQGTWR